jgi:geranylgeranyl diphosphate synthase type II
MLAPSEPAVALKAQELVEAFLRRRLSMLALPEHLADAVRYAVLGGGKRLRPVLSVLCCEAVGGKREQSLGPGGALELIHSFSLVHDDLPAMDDDDLRRGRPTLHIHSGEAMAILAGDLMMSMAVSWILDAGFEPKRTLQLVRELIDGTSAMIVGQVYDTLGGFEAATAARERVETIHHNKTGALIRAACRMGAICGNASEAHLDAISRYGDAVGLMFQIVDDIIDVTQPASHTGKATGKDANAGKLTYPGIVGIDESRRAVEQLHAEARNSLKPFGTQAAPLEELAQFLAIRTK